MLQASQRYLTELAHVLYGLFAVAVFLLCGSIALVLVLAPLGVAVRRRIARSAARAFFFAVGMPVRLLDEHNLPPGPCVVVANHASYLDGVVLKAALPARFSFVIKKEVARAPLAGLLLRRIGSEFVDRFNRHAGAMDARRLLKAADKGQSLAFFPEGTFVARPGLGKFHSGAFAVAVRASLPVAPLVIRGARRILPSNRFLPRPGVIEVQVLQPLEPDVECDAAEAAALLRQRSRERILAALDEPDLARDERFARKERTADGSERNSSIVARAKRDGGS
ncbi:MAG TPA: lysophospholipid acyltransferase family protein [Steroidobacter sp.]|nr:lysophospholipid acyltransferase family protein [Steroidobacter sp.]